MRSGFEAGSYLRLIDFVYHSAVGMPVIREKKEDVTLQYPSRPECCAQDFHIFFFITLQP